jgi:thiosulfate/3-mercaptopyruvate sulfurtransferase
MLHNRPILLAALPLALPLLSACEAVITAPTSPTAPAVTEAVAQATVQPQPPVATRPHLLVSADWLLQQQRRPNIVVVHVGALATFAAGHIPGARFLDLGSLQGTYDEVPLILRPLGDLRAALETAGVSTSDHVIVYGDDPLRAARGFFVLEYLGHPRVSLLDGGLAAWAAGGGTVAQGAPTATRPGRMVTPDWPSLNVSSAWVLANLDAENVILLDARPAAGFAAGHIPGANSLPWTDFVQAGLLKPVPDLRELYAAAGARHRDLAIMYCTSGMMSSVSYFVARYLGFDVRLYDGSWLEWTALGLPQAS